MGSSTASETTINTSTDSSNTIVTTMTATDGEGTEDSLDLHETACDMLHSDNILDGGRMGNPILQPTPVTPKTPATAKQYTPPNNGKEERKFVFDTVATPKAKEGKFVFDHPHNEHNHIQDEKSVEKLMEQQLEALKLEARRRNSYRNVQNELDKIEIVQDNKGSPQREQRRSVRRTSEHGDNRSGRASPNRGVNSSETHSPKPKHRHKKTSRKHHSPNRQKNEKFVYDERYIAR